jgi:hypothetical protein
VQLLLAVTVVLLAASIVCVVGELANPGNVVVGSFGISATALGGLVAADVGGAATALADLGRAFRPRPRPPGAQPARTVRVLGTYYVIFGTVLAVAGYGGFIHWTR